MRCAVVGEKNGEWYIAATGAKGSFKPDEIIKTCISVGEEADSYVVALNPNVVAGFEHIVVACEHAVRAWDRGNKISKYLEVEVQLYLVGSREIKKVLRMTKPRGENCVLIALSREKGKAASSIEAVLSRLDLEEDETIMEPDEKRALSLVKLLKIPEEAISIAGKEDIIGVVKRLVASRAVSLSLS